MKRVSLFGWLILFENSFDFRIHSEKYQRKGTLLLRFKIQAHVKENLHLFYWEIP